MLQSFKHLWCRIRDRGKLRVLIVSDKLFVTRFIADRLEADPSILVIARPKDAENGLFFLREVGCDAVILDLEMAVDGGLIWLESLTPEERRRCILFSSLPEDDPYVMVGMSLGAAAYVHNTGETADAGMLMEQLGTALKRLGKAAPARRPAPRVPTLQPA